MTYSQRPDRILIKNLLVRGILGINPEERVNRQDILVSMELYTHIDTAAATDDIAAAVNYKKVTKDVIAHVEQANDNLIEKLVSDVADLVLAGYPRVEAVTVLVEKPGALRFARSVGIEITRTRADNE